MQLWRLTSTIDDIRGLKVKEKVYTYKALRNKKLDKSAIVSTMPLKPTKE